MPNAPFCSCPGLISALNDSRFLSSLNFILLFITHETTSEFTYANQNITHIIVSTKLITVEE